MIPKYLNVTVDRLLINKSLVKFFFQKRLVKISLSTGYKLHFKGVQHTAQSTSKEIYSTMTTALARILKVPSF